ncbi:transglycosylase SLT domain-containing protein [Streptomyces sp. NPDC052023]|uniref:transglycosylase SLT domain-containing protein n=1 Tax=Streptomyces sp. NPDC052023 TaxID=3365681 RepID=UPI0037CF0C18
MAAGAVLVGRGYVSIQPEFEGNWSRAVNAQASSAGRDGGSAFGKAFGGALTGALRGLSKGFMPAFGTSIAAALAPAAGAAGVLATATLAAASAQTALKVGLSGVSEAVSEAFNPTSPEAFSEAMAKLAPNARAFVTQLRGTKPALDALKTSVQDRLFEQLDTTFATAAKTTLPIFQNALTNSAGALNLMGRQVLNTATGLGKSGALGTALSYANTGLYNLAGAPATLVQGLVQIGAAAGPSFAKLTGAAGGAFEGLSVKMTNAFSSGAMQEFIETGVTVLMDLGRILADAFGAVGNILKASADAGGQALAVVGELFAELRRITAMPEVQAALRTIFASVAQIAAAIAPVIGSVIQAILPLIASIAPVVAQLAQTLGPVLAQLAAQLGAALKPVIEALLPVLTLVGDAVVQILAAVTPLLQPIGELIGGIISALMPVLRPVIDLAVQLIDVLIGPLTTIIQQLVPYVELLGEVLSQVFAAITPLIAPIVGIVGHLAQVFAELYTQFVATFMEVITALMPVITELVTIVVDLALQLLSALMPSMDQIIAAVFQLMDAVLPLLPTFAELTAMLLGLAAGVLTAVLPPIVKLTGYLVGALAGALSTVIGWVAQLVTWLRRNLGPAFLWLNDKVIQPVWRGIRAAIKFAWETVIRPTFGFIKAGVSGVGEVFRWLRDKAVTPVWNGIRSVISTVWQKGIKPAFDALKTAVGRVGDAFETAKEAIRIAWALIKKATKDPINFVINTVWNKGVVKAWDKILGWVPGLPKLKTLPLLAQGGTVPARPGVFNKPTAVVGEGRSQYPEFVIPTDPRYRGRALSLWEQAGGQLMADGGIIGSIVGGIKNIGGKIGGLLGDAASFLSDPGKALGKLMSSFTEPLQAIKSSGWGKLALALPGALLKGLKDLVTGGGPAIAGVGPGGGSGVQRWRGVVRQALGLVGQPLSYDDITLRRMNQESGGNPTVVNKWDSNWIAGYPSVGLMQVIRPTFQAHAGRFRNKGPFSYGVSVDPLANVYASMRYALSAYGSLPSAYNRPGGYDSGGWLQPGWNYNGLRTPEAVLTPQQLRTLEGAAAVGVAAAQAGVTYQINARTADFTVADLERVQRVQEARARVGRPR